MSLLSFQLSSIKSKVTSGVIIVIVVVLATSVYGILNVMSVSKGGLLSELVNEVEKETLSIQSSSNEFILKDLTNEEFYNTGRSPILDTYSQSLLKLMSGIDSLSELLKEEENFHSVELVSLKEAITEYDIIFNKIRQHLKERGSENKGIIGDFKNSLEQLSHFNYNESKLILLELKYAIKDYQLSGNQAAIQNISNKTYQYSMTLEKYASNQDSQLILEALTKYEITFGKLIIIDSIIGTYSGNGLKKEMFAKMDEMKSLISLSDTEKQIKEINEEIIKSTFASVTITLLSVVSLSLAFFLFIKKNVINSILELNRLILSMSFGKVNQKIPVYATEELQEISTSLKRLSQSLITTAEFAGSVGKGDFDYKFEPLSNDDILGNALIKMRTDLKHAAEDSERRSWIAEGLARFRAIIQKNDTESTSLLLSGLVKYIDANQGALFIKKDSEMEMVSCYAWGKTKYFTKTVAMGEGLIGQCWIEGKTIYMTQVPADFVKITSGLGHTNPTAILIVPIKHNAEILGVLEVASFKKIERHVINFLETVGESLGATLAQNKIAGNESVTLEPDYA